MAEKSNDEKILDLLNTLTEGIASIGLSVNQLALQLAPLPGAVAALTVLTKNIGLITVDEHRKILAVSKKAEDITGYVESELLNKEVEVLVPDRVRVEHPTFVEGFFRHPRAREMGTGLNLTLRRKDGNEVPVDIALFPLRDGGLIVQASIMEKEQR